MPTPSTDTGSVAGLLGGAAILGRTIAEPFEAHDLLLHGLPARALDHLLSQLRVLDRNRSLESAIGISLRTFQRRQDDLSRPLSTEQSGRTWKFAAILAQATSVFGSRDAAERWLDQPAMALNHRRPIELLATPAGVDMVEALLSRLEYGVYT
jgi:putative toxin-antitoxin system antitoxin component (TIGR02293 family)